MDTNGPPTAKKKKRRVAASSLANLKPWRPGESGNISGVTSDPHKRLQRQLTQEYFKDCLDILIMGNAYELQTIIVDPTSPVLKIAIASCLQKALTEKDWPLFERILDRLIGRPKNLDIPPPSILETTHRLIVRLPSNGKEVRTPEMDG